MTVKQLSTKDIGIGLYGFFATEVQDANFEYKLATEPSSAKETGKYYVEGRLSRSPSVSHDQNARKRLWHVMAEQTGANYFA